MSFDYDNVCLVEHLAADPNFRADVLAGLNATNREIPARWFYDRRGSELFELITRLPEYYPTRIETGILASHAKEIAALTGPGRAVIEFGSGSSSKTPVLLAAIQPASYVPIDISGEFLRESSCQLAAAFPGLPVHPLEADFTEPLVLPKSIGSRRLGFFPGSTIGNLLAADAVDLLRAMARTLGTDGQLLIGIDRIKHPDILIPAYDDSQGVTAEFNLNLLQRINRELRGTIPVADFRHVARWNVRQARIEMHLQAIRTISFTVEGQSFSMRQGETIHTENSHKYASRDAMVLLSAGGWSLLQEWSDQQGLFSLYLVAVNQLKGE